jgi:hypothetical protein
MDNLVDKLAKKYSFDNDILMLTPNETSNVTQNHLLKTKVFENLYMKYENKEQKIMTTLVNIIFITQYIGKAR